MLATQSAANSKATTPNTKFVQRSFVISSFFINFAAAKIRKKSKKVKK